MRNTPMEVIKQYSVQVDGLDHPVYARIVKSISGEETHLYLGEFSHYCKPAEEAFDVYHPARVSSDFNNVENIVTSYLGNFTDIDVEKNDLF